MTGTDERATVSTDHETATPSERRTGFVDSLDEGHRWLAAALGIAAIVATVYYATHPYPAYGAGLYLAIAEQIVAHGYQMPATIPHYTAGGVPFAYPPLMFYVTAVLVDLGVDPVVLTRALPALVTIAYLVPFYYLARAVLGSGRAAGLATVLLAATPDVLQWHLSGGGIVRAPAFTLAVTGLYVGVNLFRTGDRRWLAPGAVLFGLTLLSHPTYSAFFGLSYLVFYAAYDRTRAGLVNGAAVATGGLTIAAPWVIHVARTHGVATLTGAAGTHGGFGRNLRTVAGKVLDPSASLVVVVLLAAAVAYLVWQRRYLLPGWLGVGLVLMNEMRYVFVPAVLVAATVLSEASRGRPGDRARRLLDWRPSRWNGAAFATVVVLAAAVGGLYAADVPVKGGQGLPAFVNDDDVAAMEWVEAETPPDAEFVVLGDGAEWFPYFTDRTMLVGPWGVEWVSPSAYDRHLDLFEELSACHAAGCLTDGLAREDVQPDYVYVPKGTYTVRGEDEHQTAVMRTTMQAVETYRLVYENDGAMIFRVES
ncbi:hypothetical protein ACFQH6_04795 [Halobacteriaceae archaeon GCM10025711]